MFRGKKDVLNVLGTHVQLLNKVRKNRMHWKCVSPTESIKELYMSKTLIIETLKYISSLNKCRSSIHLIKTDFHNGKKTSSYAA